MNDDYTILERRFARLVECHQGLIRRLCWRYSQGDTVRCTELMQDCYIAIWRRLPDLSDDVPPWREYYWVASRCRSRLSRHFRRLRHQWVPLDEVTDDLRDDGGHDARDRVEELTDGLSHRERHYLKLLFAGYDTSEIAESLKIKPDSVYKMRRRIIEKMRNNANNISNDTRNRPRTDA